MIYLYVIDDHYLIIEGLYSSFDLESEDFKVIGGSLSVLEAIEKINPEKTDIILLDLFIKQEEPVVNFSILQKAFPSIPIVILSHESCISWQVEMFRHGVKAFISKCDNKSEMCQKLFRVYADEVIMPDEVARILMETINIKHVTNYFPEIREIVNNLSHGMTVKEIATKMNLSESAIEKKLQLFRKVYNAKTTTELVCKALINQL